MFCYPCERLCENCKEELVRNDGLTCPKCGRKTLSNGVCLTCKSTMPKFTQAFSPFVYRGLPAKLINRLKNGNRRLAYLLGEETATYFLEKKTADLSGEPLLILPIPLTDERRIVRGYNQAEELAKVIAEKLNEGGMYATNDFETLIKRRETSAQKHLSRKDRAENITGAYHLHKRKFCQGKTIVLVDDILTTGATGSECAKLLLNAGAKAVYLLTVASAPENK